jgi:hypothetical protein
MIDKGFIAAKKPMKKNKSTNNQQNDGELFV